MAVLCEKAPKEAGPYLVTASSRTALAQISANWFGHPADEMTMIGVTGTNGKTTVTYLLKTVLEQTIGGKGGTHWNHPEYDWRRDTAHRAHDTGEL